MSNFTFLFFLTVCVIVGRAQENPNPSASVDALIAEEMELERLPGVATVIVKDGKIVWIESYGFADVENAVMVADTTIFLLSSISKLFTGTAAMQLFENGAIDLDEDVDQYLPWVLQIPGFPSDPVTFRQLMTHTSSIYDNFNVMDDYYDYPDPSISLADCMQRYLSVDGVDYDAIENFVQSPPGSVFEYSNMATALNGYLVELISGVDFDQYCNEHILSPLCMEHTAWFFSDLDSAQVARPHGFSGGNYFVYPQYGFADYPDGQLRSSVRDLANFMITYLNGGTFDSYELLSSTSISSMWTLQVPGIESTQGLNWYQEELYHDGGTSLLWGHNGGEMGSSTDMYLDPENNIGICVLTNGEGDGIYICDELYNYALTLDADSGIDPFCNPVGVQTLASDNKSDRKLVKIIDYLGRETQLKLNTPLIKIYDDGSVERVFVIE